VVSTQFAANAAEFTDATEFAASSAPTQELLKELGFEKRKDGTVTLNYGVSITSLASDSRKSSFA
jgi:hypothetical protein